MCGTSIGQLKILEWSDGQYNQFLYYDVLILSQLSLTLHLCIEFVVTIGFVIELLSRILLSYRANGPLIT